MHPVRIRQLRVWYFIAIICLIALLLVVRFFVLADSEGSAATARDIAGQVIDSLVGAAGAALAISILLILFVPEDKESGTFRFLSSDQIEGAIREGTTGAREWSVRARTARYFRRRTLPWIAASSVQAGRTVRIRVQLLDPGDVNLLGDYVDYQASEATSGREFDVNRVRREILATLVTLLDYNTRYPRLSIEVGLSRSLWLMSLDICDDRAIICGQHGGHPAILHSEGSSFYNTTRDEFEAGFASSRVLALNGRSFRLDEATAGSARLALETIQVDHSALSDEDVEQVISAARKA